MNRVKEHYQNHLSNFYSWMTGDFEENKNSFKTFCLNNNLSPLCRKKALNLGAGNGIQTVALAELDYEVTAIDFDSSLLKELKNNAKENTDNIKIMEDKLENFTSYYHNNSVDLIVCYDDTIAHLNCLEDLEQLFMDCYNTLNNKSHLILSFRDYSYELTGNEGVLPVKSDDNKILTCILEYYEDKVKVTDLLYEKIDGYWRQKINSYNKLRISKSLIIKLLENGGFSSTAAE